MILKHQQFKNGKSNKVESKSLKYPQLYIHNNKEKKSFNKFEDKNDKENIGYVCFFCFCIFFFLKKVKLPNRYEQQNIELKSPYMYIKNWQII